MTSRNDHEQRECGAPALRGTLERAVAIMGDIIIVVFVVYGFFACVDSLRRMGR